MVVVVGVLRVSIPVFVISYLFAYLLALKWTEVGPMLMTTGSGFLSGATAVPSSQ